MRCPCTPSLVVLASFLVSVFALLVTIVCFVIIIIIIQWVLAGIATAHARSRGEVCCL